ncbi:MAG: hypothetical protein HYX78_13600 [Armatimonadetes bacterium]|nr:hypothetical protein [Armatimonadota bacterium]
MRLIAAQNRNRLGNERGQSLVIAIAVMFLLVFLGMVFVLLVARNQFRAGRSRDVLAAQYLAEAGINYADKMLRTGEEGADWRPAPDNLGFSRNPATGDLTPLPNLDSLAEEHPDFKWLRPYDPVESRYKGPSGGYTTYEMGDGRFLLRLTYDPDPNDPASKHIKIESVGRVGIVDEDDPTTWTNSLRLKRELTAYKPIGVTDYLRFITNKEKRTGDIPLGAAGFNVKYGYFDPNQPEPVRGAPIRVNGNLNWYGRNIDIILRGTTYPADTGTGYLPIDLVEVSGTIEHESMPGNTPIPVNVLEVIDGAPQPMQQVFPSNFPDFTTVRGFYRDGSDYPDIEQRARSIKRLEPPLIDASDPASNVPRYITLTRDSGEWIERPDGRRVNSGRYGWGRGVYIDNFDDRQPESETLFGGYTPRADWMKPNNDMAAYWQGPYYVPPGVIITLNPYDTDGDPNREPDITITRTDIISRGQEAGMKAIWYDAAGYPMIGKGSTITIPYPQGTQTFDYNAGGSSGSITLDRNGVIYAEGNIRIRGMLAPDKQLTVVSDGIIYVEGNVLKYRDPNTGQVDKTCAIALLAKEYVCVNTTQFVSLLTSTGPTSIGSDSGTGDPPYHLVISPEPASTFFSSFSLGPPTGLWQPGDACALFVRHAGQYGPSYINMWLNRNVDPGNPFQGLLQIGKADPLLPPPYVFGCGDPRYSIPGTGISSLFEHRIWELGAPVAVNDQLRAIIGIPNYFEVVLDQSSYTRNNYLLSQFTVQPLDIRIEAIIYAQNRSFFIIPGNWFNMNAADVPGAPRPRGTDDRWPYFGQPLDTRITVDGAVTENLPARVGDVAEWYSKWSNIPERYGGSGVPTAHPGDGLTFLYDPMLGWPVLDNGGQPVPVRTDDYGRTLPIAPRLPVCESLYYYGEPT